MDILRNRVWRTNGYSFIECIDSRNNRYTWIWNRSIVRLLPIFILVDENIVDIILEHFHVINENISSFSCWLSVDNGLIWAFAAPVIIVLVINTAMFIQALLIARKSLHKRSDSSKRDKTSTSSNWTLFKGNQKTFQIIFCQANHTQDMFKCSNNFNKSLFIGSYSLMVILGLTWILGFIYFADGAEALAILFTITNSLQGVAIFIFHVILHEKARFCLLENLRNMRRNVYNLKVCLFIKL